MEPGEILKTESCMCGGELQVVEYVGGDTYLTECLSCEDWWEYDEVTGELTRDD